jgi:hypothetical protein
VDEAKYKGYDYKRQKRKDGLSLIVPALRKSFSNMKDLKKYIDKHGKMEGVNEDIDSQIDSLMKQKKRLMDKRPVPTQQVARISGKLNVLRAKKAKEKERKEGVNEGKFRVHFDLNPDASPAERLGLMSVEVKAKNKKEAEKMVADKFVGGMKLIRKSKTKKLKEDNIKLSKKEMGKLHKDGKVKKGEHEIEFNESYDVWNDKTKVGYTLEFKHDVSEAEYQGRKVKLGKPMQGDSKKFKVYVKNPKGNVVKVNFGQKGMNIKKSNPDRRKSFRARHNCDNPGPRHKARYWSCRKW